MVKRFSIRNKTQVTNFLEYITNEYCPDFFYTQDNQRKYIKDEKSLREFMRDCKEVYYLDDGTETKGIIVLWAAKGGNTKRDYIKLSAKTIQAADALLSVLLWNCQVETHVKILKKSRFLKIFYNKQFKFSGSRGSQLLLKRDKYIFKNNNSQKE